MFLDEARIAATLNHPNIVQIFDLGKADGEFFIAMEYVHGQDLRRICERGLAVGNFLPLRHAVRIIADAAGGLHYAHTQSDSDGEALGIVHRDVSPQNLVVSFDGVVKVLDLSMEPFELLSHGLPFALVLISLPPQAATVLATALCRDIRLRAAELYHRYCRVAVVRLERAASQARACLLYTSPSPRDATLSRMPSSA